MQIDKQARLDEIAEQIVDSRVCPELAESASRLVPGSGNPDAEIVFIGEAPGKREDERGVPFVGAAGKFLDTLLDSIALKREDIYITNIVKYRPPGNRDPEPEEIAAFMPHLFAQLEVITPRLIATLGRFSLNVFLPEAKISEVHGQPQRISAKQQRGQTNTWTLLPLYHPAAALYNGAMREILLADFQQIPVTLKLLNHSDKSNQAHLINQTNQTKGKQPNVK